MIGAKGPGVFWVPPLISRTRKVDLRVVTIELLPPQEGVTRDNVTVKVSAVLYFHIVNPNDAVNNVQDFYRATVADRADDTAQHPRPIRPSISC